MLGLFVHGLVAGLVGLVDLEGREALEVLQKRIAQIGVLVPVRAQDALGHLLDRHDNDGDQGHADEKDDRRGQANGCHHKEQGHRSQDRVEQLRQVLAKVGLKLLAALDRKLDDLGRGDLLGVVGTQGQQFLKDAAAQRALDVL